MESIVIAGLAGVGLAAIITGAAWSKRNKTSAADSPNNLPPEHPYETPADRFMVWPADPIVRAAPKGRAFIAARPDSPNWKTKRDKE